MEDYKEILKTEPDVCLLDGHLVDIQGTLIPHFSDKLNQPLYESMLKAHEAGEKIYIYSYLPNVKMLQEMGVDTQKFEVISKSAFKNNTYTIVTGKIVDDEVPQAALKIILTNPDGHLWPGQPSFSFERTPMPEDLAAYYQKNMTKKSALEQIKKERQEKQEISDPLEQKRKKIQRAIKDSIRLRLQDNTAEIPDLQSMPRQIRHKIQVGKTADSETGEVRAEHKVAAKVQTITAKKQILERLQAKERK